MGSDETQKDNEDCINLLLPVFKELLCVQLLSEGLSILLELLSLHVHLPALAQHSLHTLQVHLQLPINLAAKNQQKHA